MRNNGAQDTKHNLIVILGPTASGKTRLAVRLAKDMGSEIISADSRQVYRGMDIGTGKDLSEYVLNGVSVPYHLIDIVEPTYEFNLFEYQKRFYKSFSEISSRAIIPIVVGGTGLYIESIIMGYRMMEVPENPALRKELDKKDLRDLVKRLLTLNPEVHNTTDLKDRKRCIRAIEIMEYAGAGKGAYDVNHPIIIPLVIGVRWERDMLRQNITNRLIERLQSGMINEVKRLNESGIGWEKLNYFGLEYRYVGLYLQGKISYDEMFQKLNTRIHQFAKKQETWFRRMEKRGTKIFWINGNDYIAMKKITEPIMKNNPCNYKIKEIL